MEAALCMPPASVSNDFPLTLAALHCHGTPAPTEDELSWACCLGFMKSQQCCLLTITAILRSVLSQGIHSLLSLKKSIKSYHIFCHSSTKDGRPGKEGIVEKATPGRWVGEMTCSLYRKCAIVNFGYLQRYRILFTWSVCPAL